MVSLWPWKGDDTSPASFEKILSSLSDKITRQTTKLDSLRQRSRRFKALWTLYSTFVFLLYSIILALVVGWRNWSLVEYAAVGGGPVIIYVVRLFLTTYYSYRASTVQTNLDGLQKQRDTTIEKLKAATKYNTTQQLLTKYGGTPTPKVKSIESAGQRSSPNSAASKGTRMAIVPPPTANIPGRNVRAPLQNTPDRSTPSAQRSSEPSETSSPKALITPRQQQSAFRNESADFAPNAFSAAPQYSQPDQGSRWYDRILDVLLGDDEMLPRNRLALICRHCRLVNGQAPPAIKRIEDVGRWRCSGCGIMNGEETDTEKIVADIKEQAVTETDKPKRTMKTRRSWQEVRTDNEEPQADDGHESDITQYSENLDIGSSTSEKDMEKENMSEPSVEPEPPKRRVGRPKGPAKKQG